MPFFSLFSIFFIHRLCRLYTPKRQPPSGESSLDKVLHIVIRWRYSPVCWAFAKVIRDYNAPITLIGINTYITTHITQPCMCTSWGREEREEKEKTWGMKKAIWAWEKREARETWHLVSFPIISPFVSAFDDLILSLEIVTHHKTTAQTSSTTNPARLKSFILLCPSTVQDFFKSFIHICMLLTLFIASQRALLWRHNNEKIHNLEFNIL